MYVYENKLAFIAHPRTASRSTTDTLKGAGAELWDSHHEVDEDKVAMVHDAGGLVACTYRNMFDVLVSWFHRANRSSLQPDFDPEKEFTPWLETILKGGHQFLDREPYHFGFDRCNYHIRYEYLARTLETLLYLCDMPWQPLGSRGVSHRHMDYRLYYSDQTRRQVEDRWALDLEMTRYQF